jgi:mRNA-degrading endonuclease RelE of RelBE toxin-antitoxin system
MEAKYKISFTTVASAAIKCLPKDVQKHLIKRIESVLATNPRTSLGVGLCIEIEDDLYRFIVRYNRTDYRILYKVDEKEPGVIITNL